MPTQVSDFELDTTARLRAAIGKLSRRLRPTAAGGRSGLTPTAVSVLLTVARLGPIRLTDLAESEGLNPTMLSRIVANLCDAGYATRVSDPGDRRAALVSATAEGRRLRDRMRRERTDTLRVGLQKLSEADRSVLFEALPAMEELAEALRRERA